MAQKLRMAGYVRVSTEKQADHGVSIDAQIQKLRQYAALYDIDLVEIVIDRGVSGKKLDRPGLNKCLSMLTSGGSDGLLVVKLDRLTRRVQDLGYLLDTYFQKFILCSVAEQVDTRTAAGRLVLNVLTSVAQWEREIISERTKSAMRYKKSNGEYTGGRILYGFSIGDDGRTLVENPKEQKAIRMAIQKRNEGLSYRKICAELARSGVMPRNGIKWNKNTVQKIIIQNESIVGLPCDA